MHIAGLVIMYKPFLSIEDQVALLNARGLKTDSRTAWILEREGYYSVVNGYKTPFLDAAATGKAQQDRYHVDATFDDMYALYIFDRKLRFLLFWMTTIAEAILKTICSYEFTKANASEKNPYLNIANYAPTGEARTKATQLIPKLQRILDLNRDETYPDGKAYLRHCLNDHDGEVPLWVLSNDLTLGQIYWFFQSQGTTMRGNIARSFTALYKDSHKHAVEVTASRIDKVYRRIRDYRNICAHDERLYCAHPHDLNVTVFQVVKDLRFVTDKKRYLEFLQQFDSLLDNLGEAIPGYVEQVYKELGVRYPDELRDWMQQVRKS